MKVRKILALCTMSIIMLLCSAVLFACGNDSGGGGGGGGGDTDPVPTGTYILTSAEYSEAVAFSGFTLPELMQDENEYSKVSLSSMDSEIKIFANRGVSFINVGSFAVSFTQGEETGFSGTSYDMKYVANGGGYKVVKKIDSNAALSMTGVSQNAMLGGAGNAVYKMCTFTYADDVITLTMRYELASDREQGWTQTYTYTKE